MMDERTDPCCRSEDDRERGDLLCGAPGQRHRALPLLPLTLRPHRTPALHGSPLTGLHRGLRPQPGEGYRLTNQVIKEDY